MPTPVLRCRTEAEDVVQDAFVRVMEHRLIIGSLDIPGSTRRLDIDVMMEPVQ